MSQPTRVPFAALLTAFESGSRPKGGVKGIDSGVPSLGGEHLDGQGGFRLDRIRYVPPEFAAGMKRGRIAVGDILVVKDGATTGKVSLVRDSFPYRDAVINEHVFLCRCKEAVDPRYAFWYLFSASGQKEILRDFRGAAQGGISQRFAELVEVPLRPLDAQRRVVAKIEKQFSRLGETVANLKRVKATLKTYRAAVLKAAVEGHLVPTEAELARREGRSYETGAQLLQRIVGARAAAWRRKGKYTLPAAAHTSDLAELPKGWTWASVESLSTKVVDGVHKKPTYVPAGIPFVTVRNLTAGPGISFDDVRYISAEDHAEFCKRTNPERGDILITKDGTLGVARLVETTTPFSIFVSVALVKPVVKELSRYLAVAFESPIVQRQMVPKGSGLQHIHLEDLRADCIPLPPVAEQHRIVEEIDRRFSVVNAVEAQLQAAHLRADNFRARILLAAFGGDQNSQELE